jgi:hypothetical protein
MLDSYHFNLPSFKHLLTAEFQVVINQRLDDKLNPVDPAALAVAGFV